MICGSTRCIKLHAATATKCVKKTKRACHLLKFWIHVLNREINIFYKFHVTIKFWSKFMAHEIRGTNFWDTLYFEWQIKQLLNSAFVRWKELWRSWRMLSTSADNILLNLHYSSHPTQPHLIIAKYSLFHIHRVYCEQI